MGFREHQGLFKAWCVWQTLKGLYQCSVWIQRRWDITDCKLNFKENCAAMCEKGHQWLYHLRKLLYFRADKTTMTLFCRAFTESILSFSLVSWFGSLSVKNRNSFNQIVKWSNMLSGESELNPSAEPSWFHFKWQPAPFAQGVSASSVWTEVFTPKV